MSATNWFLDNFLWAGQSNAVGAYKPVPAPTPIWGNINIFAGDYRWYDADEPCSYMQRNNGANFTADEVNHTPGAGYGAIKKFGLQYVIANPTKQVGIIPCAHGGTAISEWKPNLEDTTYFGAMIKRAKAASTRGAIKGFVWIQGEAESGAGKEVEAQNWDVSFTNIITSVRVQLGNPTLPVVYAQLGNQPITTYVNWETVKQSQARVEQNVPYTKMVVMSDVTPVYQEVHYNVNGYNILGDRIYSAMAQLLGY